MTEKIKKKKKSIQSSKLFQKGKRKLPTILLLLIVGIGSFLIGKKIGLNTDTSKTNTKIEEVKVEKQTITKTLTSSGEIDTTQTEKLYLSTLDYYLSASKEVDDIVKQGETLLTYTSGAVLTAPYDLVITNMVLPQTNTIGSNHYIEVKRMDNLLLTLNISESEITNIHLGDESEITLTADSSKKYTGNITKISSTANYSSSGSTFEVEVTLVNDGGIKLGMSASSTIHISELKDVIAVPINAVQINGNKRYVLQVKNGKTEEVEVTTGLADSNYVEIKSGLKGGETIQVVTITKESTIRSSDSGEKTRGNREMPSGDFGGNRPDMGNRERKPSSGEEAR